MNNEKQSEHDSLREKMLNHPGSQVDFIWRGGRSKPPKDSPYREIWERENGKK